MEQLTSISSNDHSSRQSVRPNTTPSGALFSAMAQLPDGIASLTQAVQSLQQYGEDNTKYSKQLVANFNRLDQRMDSLLNEIHVLNILMSQMVAYQSYAFTSDTLHEDARQLRVDAVAHTKNGL